MSSYPVVSTQVIGQAESALGAVAGPLLARTATTFNQWLVLTITAAGRSGPARRRRLGRRIHDRTSRREQRPGQGDARLAAEVPELTEGFAAEYANPPQAS